MKYIKALGITSYDIGCVFGVVGIACILTTILAGMGLCALWVVELTTGIVGTLQQGTSLVMVIAGFSCGIVGLKRWFAQASRNYTRRLRSITHQNREQGK